MWATRYTSNGNNVDRASAMVTDASGNLYVTGIGWGGSNFDYVTIKYDNNGVQQWATPYNGPGNAYDEARSVVVDGSGNVYVTGWSAAAASNYDYATIKYNSAGVQQWAARYNGTANGFDEAYMVAVDGSGNVYVTGSSAGTGSNSDYATLKYNSAGVQQWVSRYNGTGNNIDAGYALTIDGPGNVYVTGYSNGGASDFDYATLKYNNAGAQQWVRRYNGLLPNSYDEARSIAVDVTGNVYVAGYSLSSGITNYDYATLKYDAAGVLQWASRYDGTGNDYDRANSLALDAAGNVYVTGRSVGSNSTAEDFATVKYNSAGIQRWVARYNSPANNYDEAKSIVLDGTDGVYITGYSYETPVKNNDYTSIKYDTAGAYVWLTKYNGTGSGSDQAASIVVDLSGNAYVTGVSKGVGTNDDYATLKYCQFAALAGIDDTICQGSSTQLNASGLNAVTYLWSPALGLNNTAIPNPIANPNVTTTYEVTITNATGCVDLDSVTVVVIPLAAPSITPSGPTTFCFGDSVTLMASVGATYLWSNADTNQSITVNASGTYSVIITNGGGCQSSNQITVTVNPLPNANAGNDTAVCLSKTVNLNATGGTSYMWHPGLTLSDSTISNPTAGPVGTTTYVVFVTDANGCVNTDTVVVTIKPNPLVPLVTVSFDTLWSTPSFAYQWFFNGVAINGATMQYHIPTQNGNYYVEVFDNLGCSTTSQITVVNDVSVSELIGLSSIRIFPNPSRGEFFISLNSSDKYLLHIYNVSGELVFTQAISSGSQKIDISTYPKGMYLLQISDGENVLNKKIVLE